MADITLHTSLFPDGSDVGAFAGSDWPLPYAPVGEPHGTPVDTGTVSGNEVSFTGLTEGDRYWLTFTDPGLSEYPYLAFTVPVVDPGGGSSVGPWQPLTPAPDCFDASTTDPSAAPPLRYRRNGDTIRLSGVIVCSAPDLGKVLAVLDEDDWPEYPVLIGVVADDGGSPITTVMRVSTTGEISTADPVAFLPLSHITFELT